MKSAILKTNGDPVGAVRELLGKLVEAGVADEILAPAAQTSGGAALALFADPAGFGALLPFAPTMGVQAARMISRVAFNDPGAKIAVLARPCEARAAVELIKLQQIRPESLIFVNLDCPGTVEPAEFARSGADVAAAASMMALSLADGGGKAPEGLTLRTACSICENSTARWGAVRVCAVGLDPAMELLIEAEEAVAAKLASTGFISFDAEAPAARDQAVKKLKTSRTEAMNALFSSFSKEAGDLDGLKKAFSTCIKCLNCMENCPICYCKLCIFKSTTFDHPSERYPRWAARKGAQKMPAETMLFHLTRLNHMSSSCIGCGICDTACPMGLPVSTLFRKVAAGVQGMLDYSAGASVDDQIPLSKFREDELQAEAGAKD